MTEFHSPDLMPVLSRGKHRSPRKGGCFMEMASYLAGERWSDHPDCTHRLLAALARDVNDHVADDRRQELLPLVPAVIGLNGDDLRVDAWIARDAACTALPIASAERQGVAAVGILRCERALNSLEGRPIDHVSEGSELVLNQVPHALRWARSFSRIGHGGQRSFYRRSAPSIVHSAVVGIANASVDDTDGVLVELLRRTIDRAQVWFGTPAPAPDLGQLRALVR